MGGSEGGALDEDAMMYVHERFINGENEEDRGGGGRRWPPYRQLEVCVSVRPFARCLDV